MVLFGHILVLSGLITKADLEIALKEQKKSSKLLGEILRERGLVSSAELWRAWTKQLTLKSPLLGELKAPTSVRRLAFGELAEHYNAVPISVSKNSVTLLINSKDDISIVDDLRILFEIENITVASTSPDVVDELLHSCQTIEIATCSRCNQKATSPSFRVALNEEGDPVFLCEVCYEKVANETGLIVDKKVSSD